MFPHRLPSHLLLFSLPLFTGVTLNDLIHVYSFVLQLLYRWSALRTLFRVCRGISDPLLPSVNTTSLVYLPVHSFAYFQATGRSVFPKIPQQPWTRWRHSVKSEHFGEDASLEDLSCIYASINFTSLYRPQVTHFECGGLKMAHSHPCQGRRGRCSNSQASKLKAVLLYFEQVLREAPRGYVSFHRRVIQEAPKWELRKETLQDMVVQIHGKLLRCSSSNLCPCNACCPAT